jgi:hypothetical protein
MKPVVRYALYALGLGAAGVATYFAFFHRNQMELIPALTPTTPQGTPSGPRVQNRERAKGAVAALQAFLDWWDANGPFAILVAPDGGVRTDAAKQAMYYEQGNSKARTLEETPHGRGAALDLWPVGFNPRLKLEAQPEVKAKFETMGRIAKEQFGLTWGGDWGWDFPHVEVKNWRRSLPYPPSGLSGLGGRSRSSYSGLW